MRIKRIVLLLLIFFFGFFICYREVSATTVSDLRKGLAKLEQDKKENEENSAAVQEKIAQAEAELEATRAKIDAATKEKEDKENEIKELEEKIKVKKAQIKDLVVFYQLSSNRNFYLEYIFGADSFTDLIYRLSVIEQLTASNNELIGEMKELIEENKKKLVELEEKKKELAKLNDQILIQIQQLGAKSHTYFEEGADIDEQIAAAKKQIKFYLDQGCGENDNINSCIKTIPPDSDLIRPVTHGVVTDNYGWRTSPCRGCSAFHKGIDIGGNRAGTPVYASASGVVVSIDRFTCGGKVLTINHKVNGENLATRYWHLYAINVSEGQYVTKGQQVAQVGGDGSYYDSCSTGAHLHFEVLKGHYNASIYPSNVVDPRTKVNFPAYGVWW